MKIASVQMQTEGVKSKNSVEPKQDEFSNVLSKAITKESESPNRNENLDQEPKDENEDDVRSLVDSLVGMLNVSFVEITDLNVIPQELTSLLAEKNTESIVNISNSISNEQQGFIDSGYTTLATKENVLKTDGLSSNMNNIENIKFTEASPTVGDIDMAQIEDVVLSNGQKINEKVHPVPQLTEKGSLEKANFNQSSINNDLSNDDISINQTLNITTQEVTKEVEPNEGLSIKKDQDVNFSNSIFDKDLNKISFMTKIDSKQPVQFNDNMQKINDTIIQLMETTTEGNTNVIKVKLFPENLGTVNVTLRMEEGRLIAKILVDNDYVKSLFANKVNELNESLVKQNIHLEKINIDLNLNSNSNNNSNFDLNQNGSFSQGRENHSRRNKYEIFNNEFVNSAIHDDHILNSGAISILA